MPTKNPRYNITLEPETAMIVEALMKQQGKSASGLMRDLIQEAIDHREDLFLSHLAEARDTGKQKTVAHEHVWKRH